MEQELKNNYLKIENRQKAELGGISDVEYFNESEISAVSNLGNVLIRGEKLHIDRLSVENETMAVSGTISAVIYSEKSGPKKGFFAKLFK
ncbi:MAG: sporulation protein YabP [Clostridiales bacterium]|nr:sporulation protein YabP [Clostridiales bacterium]